MLCPLQYAALARYFIENLCTYIKDLHKSFTVRWYIWTICKEFKIVYVLKHINPHQILCMYDMNQNVTVMMMLWKQWISETLLKYFFFIIQNLLFNHELIMSINFLCSLLWILSHIKIMVLSVYYTFFFMWLSIGCHVMFCFNVKWK